ncbi:MAG: hypothetical protein HYS12_23575 [Planctomycetes bacterium]|nr:hypothetical protein [Planctomycetota bacterium]
MLPRVGQRARLIYDGCVKVSTEKTTVNQPEALARQATSPGWRVGVGGSLTLGRAGRMIAGHGRHSERPARFDLCVTERRVHHVA